MTTREWTAPKEGAVKVANTAGCERHTLGNLLAAGEPGPQQLVGVVLVDGRTRGADEARRLPQAL